MEKETIVFYSYNDLSKTLELEDYFLTDTKILNAFLKRFKNRKIAFYKGNATIDLLTDIEEDGDVSVLIVDGDLTIENKLEKLSYHNIYGLAVTGSLKCESLRFQTAALTVWGDLFADKYVFTELPSTNLSFIKVQGDLKTKYIFKGDNGQTKLDINNSSILDNVQITKLVQIDIDASAFIVDEDNCRQVTTGDLYFKKLLKHSSHKV